MRLFTKGWLEKITLLAQKKKKKKKKKKREAGKQGKTYFSFCVENVAL